MGIRITQPREDGEEVEREDTVAQRGTASVVGADPVGKGRQAPCVQCPADAASGTPRITAQDLLH